ncbi:MAG TPA: hypothetical protein VKE25_15520 [Actinomycetes bacterium]|nr:hypothetical protein [Actinomycetes bacterium]
MVPLAVGEADSLVAGDDVGGCALDSSEDPPQPARSTITLTTATKPLRRLAIPMFMISSFDGEIATNVRGDYPLVLDTYPAVAGFSTLRHARAFCAQY